MHELARNRKRVTAAAEAAWDVLVAVSRLSQAKAAGELLLAWLPPTLAAAMTTASGFSAARNAATAAWLVRSSSRRVRETRLIPGSDWRRRVSAPPTMPLC